MNISRLRNIRLALSFFVLTFGASTIAQVIPVSPLTQDGAAPAGPTLTFLWTSPQAKAVLIFIPGGEGRLRLTPERTSLGGFYGGVLKPLSDPALTSALFNVVVFDSPVTLQVGTLYPSSRASADHLMRIDSVVRYYKNKFNLPVWLMGHSNGVPSIVEYFKKLQDTREESIIEGMVYSSARMGAFFRTGTRVPILFLAHEQDGCAKSPVYNSRSHYKELAEQGNTQLQYVLIHGGQAEGDPCSSGFHMFNGAYEQAYRAIDVFASQRLMLPAGAAAELQRTLAPGGKLRVGVNFGAPSSAIRDDNTGELTGVAHDLGRELARRLNVPFEPVLYRRSAEVVAALKTGDIDVAFVTLTADRAKEIDFSPPYLQIEKGALVPGDSPAKMLADIDQPGMRVAVLGGGTADSTLSREFRNAAIIRALSIDGGLDLIRAGEADAFVAQKTILFEMSRQLARSRVLDGRFGIELHAIAIPQGRDAGKDFIQAFAVEVRNSGLVRALIEKAGLRGASVYKN